MRKLVSIFLGMGTIGIIAGILSVIKWGILYFDEVYLLFSLSINGILIIIGFFGAWIIKNFDDYRKSSRDYKKEIDGKTEDLNKDIASISNRLLQMEGNLIDLNGNEKIKEKSKKK